MEVKIHGGKHIRRVIHGGRYRRRGTHGGEYIWMGNKWRETHTEGNTRKGTDGGGHTWIGIHGVGHIWKGKHGGDIHGGRYNRRGHTQRAEKKRVWWSLGKKDETLTNKTCVGYGKERRPCWYMEENYYLIGTDFRPEKKHCLIKPECLMKKHFPMGLR